MWKKIKKSFFTPQDHAPPPRKKELPFYRSDRFFYQSSLVSKNGSSAKDGWYFLVRGGDALGPFSDKSAAQSALDEIIAEYKKAGFTARE